MRAVRPFVGNRAALRAMPQSAREAALAYAFRERLSRAEVALLVAPFRATFGRERQGRVAGLRVASARAR